MTSLELKYGPSCSGDTVTIPGIKVEIFILIRNDSPEVLSRTLVKKFNEMKDEMFVQIEKKNICPKYKCHKEYFTSAAERPSSSIKRDKTN